LGLPHRPHPAAPPFRFEHETVIDDRSRMPTSYDDSYAFIVYALPTAKTIIPAPQAGVSTVRLLDGVFQSMALATAEYRGTSMAASSGIPAGVLPPTAQPPCATDGSPVQCSCVAGPQ
jgi:hypothetical protein